MQLGMLFIPNPINNSNINSLVNIKLVFMYFADDDYTSYTG